MGFSFSDVLLAGVCPPAFAAVQAGKLGAKAAKNLSKEANSPAKTALLATSPLAFSALEGFQHSSNTEKAATMALPGTMLPYDIAKGMFFDQKA